MILVTGANGVIGSELVSELCARGAPLRVFVRDAQKVKALPAHVERAIGSFSDPASLRAALRGVSRVFLLSPNIDPTQFERTLAEISAAGAPHIVKLSTLEAGHGQDGIARWHRAEEEQIAASGLSWTFVRPGNFASNALHWAASIRSEGAAYAPTGAGKSAPIDPRDIAEVAGLVLCEPGHEGKAYPITGPELLNVADQVAILARLLGRPLRFVDVDSASMAKQLLDYHTPAVLVTALAELWESIRRGDNAVVTDTLPRLLGRPARSFESWARAHLAAFG